MPYTMHMKAIDGFQVKNSWHSILFTSEECEYPFSMYDLLSTNSVEQHSNGFTAEHIEELEKLPLGSKIYALDGVVSVQRIA